MQPEHRRRSEASRRLRFARRIVQTATWPGREELSWRDEIGMRWSLIRMYWCEVRGGHRWSEPHKSPPLSWCRTCSSCGCAEALPKTAGTACTMALLVPNIWNGFHMERES
jgi:hypothetical protein